VTQRTADDPVASAAAEPLEVTLGRQVARAATLSPGAHLQGAVTDGAHWFAITRTVDSASGHGTLWLIKVPLSGAESADQPTVQTACFPPDGATTNRLGHGNDIAWNADLHRLLFPAWDNDTTAPEPEQERALRMVDPDSLRVVDTIYGPRASHGLSYEPVSGRYVGGKAGRYLWVARSVTHVDGRKELIEEAYAETPCSGIPQTIDCDEDFIYLTTSESTEPSSAQVGNRIFVLDWDFNRVASYSYEADRTPSTEIESLTHVGDAFCMGLADSDMGTYELLDFQYRIVYDAAGGEGAMASTRVPYGRPTPLRPNAFIRDGHTFAGWSARRDDGAVRYRDPGDPDATTWAQPGAEPVGWEPFRYTDTQIVARTVRSGTVTLTAHWA